MSTKSASHSEVHTENDGGATSSGGTVDLSDEQRHHWLSVIHAAEQDRKSSRSGGTTCEIVAGVVICRDGVKTYRLENESGETEWFDRPTDNSASNPVGFLESTPSFAWSSATERESAVRDAILPIAQRFAALQEWLATDNDGAAQFVVDELSRPELEEEWRRRLIYACDVIRIPPALRAPVADALLGSARRLRTSQKQSAAEAVWCAIHRAGSLIPFDRAGELGAFLATDGYVDTRLAAIQAIVHIFEVQPASEPGRFAKLADRIMVLATKHWDDDVFTPGERSAIAVEATIALASLRDERVFTLLGPASVERRRWIGVALHRRLAELRSGWLEKRFDPAADEFLEKALALLPPN